MQNNFSLINKTRGKTPRVPFDKIKDAVLGPKYELSLAFIPPAQMLEITRRTKRKDHVSNVLSFPLSKTSGEILICPRAAEPFSVEYLFIHGLFHLKGLKHGATMERNEREVLARFVSYGKDRNGNRRRHLPGQGSHSRAAR
ncbi:MAG TPA: rRNA maturation RNAse YbeY [Candidatus Paceibacterota bacterium]|nr:rRNA maturation RNAse YbeY [Candidatus Paceibacterota bacterium]